MFISQAKCGGGRERERQRESYWGKSYEMHKYDVTIVKWKILNSG